VENVLLSLPVNPFWELKLLDLGEFHARLAADVRSAGS
jgi:hypothetical protein